MIEYAFVRNHVGGGALVVLTLSLAVFAVHVPTLVGFTVARYHDPEDEAATSAPPTQRAPRLRHLAGRNSGLESALEAPVAQLDRASVYGTEGREFESLRAR